MSDEPIEIRLRVKPENVEPLKAGVPVDAVRLTDNGDGTYSLETDVHPSVWKKLGIDPSAQVERKNMRSERDEALRRAERLEEALRRIKSYGLKYEQRSQHFKAIALLAMEALGGD